MEEKPKDTSLGYNFSVGTREERLLEEAPAPQLLA